MALWLRRRPTCTVLSMWSALKCAFLFFLVCCFSCLLFLLSFVVYCLLFVVCCLLFVVCCLLLLVVSCLLFVVNCLLFVVVVVVVVAVNLYLHEAHSFVAQICVSYPLYYSCFDIEPNAIPYTAL